MDGSIVTGRSDSGVENQPVVKQRRPRSQEGGAVERAACEAWSAMADDDDESDIRSIDEDEAEGDRTIQRFVSRIIVLYILAF